LSVTSVLSQKAQPNEAGLPKYDLHTEPKTNEVVDDLKVVSLGTGKDFTELLVKSGDDKVYMDVCPRPFQEEMGISFGKGDEIAVTCDSSSGRS
jgi:hypothetical protein